MRDYSNLLKILKERNISKTELGEAVGLSSRTVAKIGKGEKLSRTTMERISYYLGCLAEDLYREVSDNKLLQRLRDEMHNNISGGIYHELQIRLTYNSNHMEGSRLSEEQTRMIFETNTIGGDEGISINDILETVHHFRAVDYCITHAEEKLTEEMIKRLHYILKHDTVNPGISWFAIGDYKKRPNTVGGKETAKPAEVKTCMENLLQKYNNLPEVTLQDIVEFHAIFEQIHPFQDGNGRVGRLIAFKECLKHNIIPFIIEDEKKAFYYRGLSNWNTEHGWLVDTCLDGQDTVNNLMRIFEL